MELTIRKRGSRRTQAYVMHAEPTITFARLNHVPTLCLGVIDSAGTLHNVYLTDDDIKRVNNARLLCAQEFP